MQHPAWLAQKWLIHGFSLRSGGVSTVYDSGGDLNLGLTPADTPANVAANRNLLVDVLTSGDTCADRPRLTAIRQVHSAEIHVVRGKTALSPTLTGDGLLTNEPGELLGILTADCVPVLIADWRLRAVGVFHAGWRGTVQGIVDKGVHRMVSQFGSKPQDLRALIGPAIGACCYTVGPEVQEAFRTAFDYAPELMAANPSAQTGTVQLDLREANRRQLLHAGVPEAHIDLLGGCTSCAPECYFSHRQSGGHTGRMMSVAGIRQDAGFATG